MSNNFCIVKEHHQMLSYVDFLQHKNAEALSFYPKCVFEREIENGRIFLGLLNGEPCGYLYVGSGRDGIVRCHQVCIQYDARRRLYGAQLVACLEDYAEGISANLIQLRCGFDLDANDFWKSLGYAVIDIHDGGARRMRQINVWVKFLQATLFEPVYLEAAKGKTDASEWRKNKQTGVVTQFVRGKRMKDYRAIVTET